MRLPIVKYGDPVLTERAAEVTEFDKDLHKLIDDLFETMYGAPGVGLAAPQVGQSMPSPSLAARAIVRPIGRAENRIGGHHPAPDLAAL